MKFANNTAENEIEYWNETERFSIRCEDNFLELNVEKLKEKILCFNTLTDQVLTN